MTAARIRATLPASRSEEVCYVVMSDVCRKRDSALLVAKFARDNSIEQHACNY
jgi:hypothetical protein